MMRSRIAVVVGAISILLSGALPAAAQESSRSAADCSLTSTGMVPLTDLGSGTYLGEEGGLYPGGVNTVPADHAALGLWHAAQIEPRDTAGNPDPAGSIVVLSIGVSNTRSEFGMLRRRVGDSADTDVLLVNGAQPGEDISQWQSADSHTWTEIEGALAQNEVSAAQVQAVWVKLPDIVEPRTEIPPFPENASIYRDQLAVVVQNAMDRFPNLRVAYLSTRIYAGYNTSGRPSPEPLAYQNGFGAKWLIADQIEGDMSLNADPRRGPIESPWLAWGPYMWADGTTPRSDGLVWECTDLQDDGIHPSQTGAVKVADMLLEHFGSDPTSAPWFSPDAEAIGDVSLPPPAEMPVTTLAPTTTTTVEPAEIESTTTVTSAPASERPGAPNRADREEERLARRADNAEERSNTGILVGTALALLAVLAVGAIVGRQRRKADVESPDE